VDRGRRPPYRHRPHPRRINPDGRKFWVSFFVAIIVTVIGIVVGRVRVALDETG